MAQWLENQRGQKELRQVVALAMFDSYGAWNIMSCKPE